MRPTEIAEPKSRVRSSAASACGSVTRGNAAATGTSENVPVTVIRCDVVRWVSNEPQPGRLFFRRQGDLPGQNRRSRGRSAKLPQESTSVNETPVNHGVRLQRH